MITDHPITAESIRNIPQPQPSEQARLRARTLIPTPYKLTRKQEDALIETIKTAYDDYNSKMDEQPKDAAGKSLDSWRASRERWENHFNNDVTWRTKDGSIWAISNMTLNLSRVFCRRMQAKAISYFFSTDPWFAAYPEGVEDMELAEPIEKHARWKINQGDTKQVMRQASDKAFILGECVVKTLYDYRTETVQWKGKILVDDQQAPLLTGDGQFIYFDDGWIDDPKEIARADDAAQQQGIIRRMGQAWDALKVQVFGGSGIPQVLAKDTTIPKPEVTVWKEGVWTRTYGLFNGPQSEIVPYLNFIAPLDVGDLQEADFIAHIYDKPMEWLAGQLNNYDPSDDDLSEVDHAVLVENAIILLKKNYQPNTPDANDSNKSKESHTPRILQLAECHMIFDADQDGKSEKITVIVDRENWLPIYYNWTRNVTETGMRPFTTVRSLEVANCWWGIGVMQIFESAQEFIDRCVNRIEGRNQESGRITFWNPWLTVEGAKEPDLKLNHGKTYTMKSAEVDPGKVLSYVVLPPLVADTYKVMELVMQVMQQESGVITADANQASGLDQTKLATGIKNIERAGNELFGVYLQALELGLTSILKTSLTIIYTRMDKKEIFSYAEGSARKITELSPEQVRGISLNINLLMTRQKSEEALQQSLQGINIAKDFYALPPEQQERLKDVYIEGLKALGWQDADRIIKPMTPPMALPAPQTGAPAAVAAPETPTQL